ncbi:hypothetical protein DMUE_4253 [Dictyocoela muelleri]|nr:hypothetical protein DMUE_4253 [Dictyocoela muelleri]
MIITYLNFFNCYNLNLVCKDGIEFPVEVLEFYPGLKRKLEEIKPKIDYIYNKKKLISSERSLIPNMSDIKLITSFNSKNVEIFAIIISTKKVPNSKKVNLEECLLLFHFFKINDKKLTFSFAEKFLHLLFLKLPSIKHNSILKSKLISQRMIKYILSNFYDISITQNLKFSSNDALRRIVIKSVDQTLIFLMILDIHPYHKQFELVLYSKENNFYDEQQLRLISSKISIFRQIKIISSEFFSKFLDRLTRINDFVDNLYNLTLEINDNFTDLELNILSKFQNIEELRIICKFDELPFEVRDKIILKIPKFQNLKLLEINDFKEDDFDFSNVNPEKIKSIFFLDCILFERYLEMKSVFPYLENFMLSFSVYDKKMLQEFSKTVQEIKTLKTITIKIFIQSVHDYYRIEEMIQFKMFTTPLVAFIQSNESSISIQENSSDVDHSSFYNMVRIFEFKKCNFYGVTKFPDCQDLSNFNLNVLSFNNLTLSDFNFEILTKLAFLDSFSFNNVILSKKVCDYLRKIENVISLILKNVTFEDTSCFAEIIKKLKYTIKILNISKTNLSIGDILSLEKCFYLNEITIDQREFTAQNLETLFSQPLESLEKISLYNGGKISRNLVILLLKNKTLRYLTLHSVQAPIRNILAENGEIIYEENYLFIVKFNY